MTETNVFYSFGNYSIVFVQDGEHSQNLACAALLLLLVLTLILNSFVFLTIIFSPLRSSSYNASIATLAALSVVDGTFNLTSSIVFHASWAELPHLYGESATRKWCSMNATLLQMAGLVQSFVYAIIVYDRKSLLPSRSEECDDRARRKARVQTLVKVATPFTVVASIVVSLPVGLGPFATSFFEQRMSCNPAYVSRHPVNVLLAAITTFIYVATWLFTLRTSYEIVRKVLNERRRLLDLDRVARLRDPFRGATNTNTECWRQICGSSEEHPLYVLTGLLVSSFLIGVVPNIIAGQVTQFYSLYDSQDAIFPKNDVPPTDLKPIHTNIFDSIFAWIRHWHNAFSPSLVLLIHSDVRKHCKVTFCCCRLGKKDFPRLQLQRSIPAFIRRKKKNETVADYRTPVLFATSEGLHLRTVFENGDPHEPEFFFQFCDLILEEIPKIRQVSREVSNKSISLENDTQKGLGETFVVQSRNSELGDGFVKYSNRFHNSQRSGFRDNTIELKVVSDVSSWNSLQENGNS